MKTRTLVMTARLLASVQVFADSKTERRWHPARVRAIQRVPDHEDWVTGRNNGYQGHD
jgi:hypothetical protein